MQDLDKFKNEMNLSGQNVYVGHRYVPKIFGEWDDTQIYEPLSIVQYQGASYTSRQYVPVGIEITNEDFWVVTGNYNAQVEQYRQEVRTFDNRINENETSIVTLDDRINDNETSIVALDEKTTETANVIDIYVSPKNFNTLQECIDYARENQKYIKADSITLTNHVNFRGVGLDIKEININGYSIELGDYNASVDDHPIETPEGGKTNRPTQTIKTINGQVGFRSEVYIRGACYQTINIEHYNGYVQIRMNGNMGTGTLAETYPNRYVAYNTFNFRNVRGIEIGEDPNSENSNIDLWSSENDYYLNNTLHFKLGDNGGYHHSMNRIHGGTFEGNSTIKILSGRNNQFYNLRGEGNLRIELGEGTTHNYIEMSHNTYLPIVNDQGVLNTILGPDDKNMRLLHQNTIATNHEVGGNEGGFILEPRQPFKNLTFDRDLGYWIERAREGVTGNSIYYVSPFISNPETVRVVIESHLSKGSLGYGYKYYDENYNDITTELADNGFTAYINSTFENHLQSPSNRGQYQGPSRTVNIYNNAPSGLTDKIENDVISVIPGGQWWTPAHATSANRVKYVKFFVGGSVEGYADTSDVGLYDLTVSIYDSTGNYRKRYFNNYAIEL